MLPTAERITTMGGGQVRRKYTNPPVIEALVELHFADVAVDATLGDRFAEAWKGLIVRRDPMHQIHFTFGPVDRPPPLPPAHPTLRLWMDAPRVAIQVGPQFLSIHLLEQPYPGQEVYRPLLTEAIGVYLGLQRSAKLDSVAMRYVNKLLVPVDSDGYPSGWLEAALAPEPPRSLQERIASFLVQWVSELPSRQGYLTYELRTGGAEDKQEYLLDLAVRADPVPALQNLDSWLDEAHQVIVSAFEDSITDEARAAFGEFDATVS